MLRSVRVARVIVTITRVKSILQYVRINQTQSNAKRILNYNQFLWLMIYDTDIWRIVEWVSIVSFTIADWQSQSLIRNMRETVRLNISFSFSSRVSLDFMQSLITFYIYGTKGELRMRGLKPRENERIRVLSRNFLFLSLPSLMMRSTLF